MSIQDFDNSGEPGPQAHMSRVFNVLVGHVLKILFVYMPCRCYIVMHALDSFIAHAKLHSLRHERIVQLRTCVHAKHAMHGVAT